MLGNRASVGLPGEMLRPQGASESVEVTWGSLQLCQTEGMRGEGRRRNTGYSKQDGKLQHACELFLCSFLKLYKDPHNTCKDLRGMGFLQWKQ